MKVARIAARLRRHCQTAATRPAAARARLGLHWRKDRAVGQPLRAAATQVAARTSVAAVVHSRLLQLFDMRRSAPMHPPVPPTGGPLPVSGMPTHNMRAKRAWRARPMAPAFAMGAPRGGGTPLRFPCAPVGPLPASPAMQRRLQTADTARPVVLRSMLRPASPQGVHVPVPIRLSGRALQQWMTGRSAIAPAAPQSLVKEPQRLGHRQRPNGDPSPLLTRAPAAMHMPRRAISPRRASTTAFPNAHLDLALAPQAPFVQARSRAASTTSIAAPLALTLRPAPARPDGSLGALPSPTPPQARARATATPPMLDAVVKERIVAEAREAVRHEMHSSTNLERLASDLLARIDKRQRIERERRGR